MSMKSIPRHNGKRDIALIAKPLEIDEPIRKVYRSASIGCVKQGSGSVVADTSKCTHP